VTPTEYNYATFNLRNEMGKFSEFQTLALHTGSRAPDFPLEDLETGQSVSLKDLWGNRSLIIEFGSYT
jgi:hypothetical protein